MKRSYLSTLLILSILLVFTTRQGLSQGTNPAIVTAPAAATGTSFTYQGRLEENNRAANGAYDFRFRLFDALTSGAQVGSTHTLGDQTVTNGLFTVSIDFGAVFNGTALWLEVAVRPGASTDAYEVLAPRQALETAPYASYALGSPWAGLSGVPAGFADGVDNNTTYTAGTGINLSGGAFSLRAAYRLPQSCANGQLAEWNGTAWICSDFTHNHWGETWTGGYTGLTLESSTNGLIASGAIVGVYGKSTDPNGYGVYGIADNTSGVNYGAYGRSDSSDGYGVYGKGSLSYGLAAEGNDDSWYDLYGDLILKGVRGEILTEGELGLGSNSYVYIDLDNDNNNPNACFQIFSGANTLVGQTCENGTKSAVLQTASYGQRAVYTVESPEVWLEEFGSAALVNGEASVSFEATFAEMINTEIEYHVFVTPLCAQPVLLFITAKTPTGFTVNGVTLDNQPADCAFDYHIVAKRIGLEDYRLEEVSSER